ncbi:P-loop containing nucleoside triphosphate hydrolase protein [Neocallimastix sp. 'constans']
MEHSEEKNSNNKSVHSKKREFPADGNNNQHGKSGFKKSKKNLIGRAKALLPQRKALPIYSARDKITKEILNNKALIIVGETGSGKTTQIPQFLHYAGLSKNGIIACTQPRRVAAMSIARRVSEEFGTRLGDRVGYSIRFDDKTSPNTIIKYMTDGMLLRELLSDNMLKKYSVVILDEAHERTLRTDILFGMLKSIQRKRDDLKIIVMSATLDAEKFSEYFDNAKIMYIAGRQFPVKLYQTIQPQEDYLDSAIVTIFQIHTEQPDGDILTFLTGQEEIEAVEKLIIEHAKLLPVTAKKLIPCPIFASMPTDQQNKVFEPAPPDTRKVILATNIAETSITISGIKYVIDCGVAKVRGYNSKIGIESLTIQPISKASARQRMGRAGREAPGCCYRLYTEDAFDELADSTEPEIKRCNLASVILLLKASGVEDIFNFDYLDRPSKTSVARSLEQLYALGALNDDGTLSELGKKMAEFPIEPTYAKVIIQSEKLGCTKEILSIVSMLSVDSIFYTPQDKREEAAEAKKKFVNFDGDHITLLNVLKGYQDVHGDKDWCYENFINIRNMKHVLDVRKQLVQFCERLKIDVNSSCGHDYDMLLKCLLSGFFQNTALRQLDGSYRAIVSGQIVYIHPTSVLFGRKPEAIMYNDLILTSKQYMRNASAIHPNWIAQTAPKYFGNRSLHTL